MKLENLETKEPLIKDFFTWLFDDERIINKEIVLENEIDLTLAPYYMDFNIYYPKQIANFFNSKAMQRLGRISQLDLVIDEFPNTYHNRLEHSKGVYNRKLEEMLHNFENSSWRKKIENKRLKLYILADLIKMAGHDIGHLPLSHALETELLSNRGSHEIIGKRIMLENSEIHSILKSISPLLPDVIKDLYEKDIFNFQKHDESNYDVDRLDYIFRDNLYVGSPVFLPYLHYTTIPTYLNKNGFPKINSDNSIITCKESNSTIDVYDYSSLHDIETFLELRELCYKDIYFSRNTQARENSVIEFLKIFLSTNSQVGENLRNFATILKNSQPDTVDLSLYLEWDDIRFYSEILDIAEKHEDCNIRLLATMTIPKLKSFLTIVHSHLNIHNKEQIYSIHDKEFLKKIKKIIQGENALSKNLKTPNFSFDNTLIFPENKPLPNHYDKLIENGSILSSTKKIKAYNPKEPIYIKDINGKIYDLSYHPCRKCDWANRSVSIHMVYSFIPLLRFNGISNNQIQEICDFCKEVPSQDKSKHEFSINMQPLKIDHNIEDCFLEL